MISVFDTKAKECLLTITWGWAGWGLPFICLSWRWVITRTGPSFSSPHLFSSCVLSSLSSTWILVIVHFGKTQSFLTIFRNCSFGSAPISLLSFSGYLLWALAIPHLATPCCIPLNPHLTKSSKPERSCFTNLIHVILISSTTLAEPEVLPEPVSSQIFSSLLSQLYLSDPRTCVSLSTSGLLYSLLPLRPGGFLHSTDPPA